MAPPQEGAVTLLSISAAARRVRRDRRTIRRWIRAGMPTLEVKDDAGRVVAHYVEEELLLRYFRQALEQDPTRAAIRNEPVPRPPP